MRAAARRPDPWRLSASRVEEVFSCGLRQPGLVFTTDGAALSSSNQYNSNSRPWRAKRADLSEPVTLIRKFDRSLLSRISWAGRGKARHTDATGSHGHRRATQGSALGELTWLRLDRYDDVFCTRKRGGMTIQVERTHGLEALGIVRSGRVHWNLGTAALCEEALRRGEGTWQPRDPLSARPASTRAAHQTTNSS